MLFLHLVSHADTSNRLSALAASRNTPSLSNPFARDYASRSCNVAQAFMKVSITAAQASATRAAISTCSACCSCCGRGLVPQCCCWDETVRTPSSTSCCRTEVYVTKYERCTGLFVSCLGVHAGAGCLASGGLGSGLGSCCVFGSELCLCLFGPVCLQCCLQSWPQLCCLLFLVVCLQSNPMFLHYFIRQCIHRLVPLKVDA